MTDPTFIRAACGKQTYTPHYGIKEHASVDTNHGFVLATAMTPASVNDTNYLPYCTVYSRHTEQSIEKVYADKGYAGKPNRDFLALNNIDDGIMRKDSTTAKFTKYEKDRNKKISKFDTLLNSILGSAIFTMVLKKHGLPTSLKTKLMFGTAKQRSISQGDCKS